MHICLALPPVAVHTKKDTWQMGLMRLTCSLTLALGGMHRPFVGHSPQYGKGPIQAQTLESWVLMLALTHTGCVTLDKLFNFCMLWVPHLQNVGNYSTDLMESLWYFNEHMHLAQGLPHSKPSVNWLIVLLMSLGGKKNNGRSIHCKRSDSRAKQMMVFGASVLWNIHARTKIGFSICMSKCTWFT